MAHDGAHYNIENIKFTLFCAGLEFESFSVRAFEHFKNKLYRWGTLIYSYFYGHYYDRIIMIPINVLDFGEGGGVSKEAVNNFYFTLHSARILIYKYITLYQRAI